jgi:ABC-type polysaccharide/polyol phosphate transport system ATPase subunit
MDRVQVEAVSKRYRLGERATTAREALPAALGRLVRRPPDARELWSLRDVTFRVGDGEPLGIVGANGAGKSTILKVLAGITSPTIGVVRTRGRVAALLEVGTGFHPELTGRENVFLNGAILGMSRRDIASRYDAIVDFAGVARFLDTPVKRYSSGMYLRLAFAVAAHLEPDVLVVDEVLAVGDAAFQRRCIGQMAKATDEGRTVVFVSHDLEVVRRLCPRCLWLDEGRVRTDGPTGDVVRRYLESIAPSSDGRAPAWRAGPLTVRGVEIRPRDPGRGRVLLRDEPLRIEVSFWLDEVVPGLDLSVYVTTSTGVRVLDQALSDRSGDRLAPGVYRAVLDVPPLLNVGEYTVGVWFGTAYDNLLDVAAAGAFSLQGSDRGRPGRVVVLDLPLSVEPSDGAS